MSTYILDVCSSVCSADVWSWTTVWGRYSGMSTYILDVCSSVCSADVWSWTTVWGRYSPVPVPWDSRGEKVRKDEEKGGAGYEAATCFMERDFSEKYHSETQLEHQQPAHCNVSDKRFCTGSHIPSLGEYHPIVREFLKHIASLRPGQ